MMGVSGVEPHRLIRSIEQQPSIAVEVNQRSEDGPFEFVRSDPISGAPIRAVALPRRADVVAIPVTLAGCARADVAPVAVLAGDQAGEHVLGMAVAETLGPPRMLMNVAGIGGARRVVGRDGSPMALDDFRRVIDVNLMPKGRKKGRKRESILCQRNASKEDKESRTG